MAGTASLARVEYKTPPCHQRDLELPEQTAFAVAVERIGKRNLVELFEGRANRTTIANWKAGRHPAPQWAIDRLQQEWQAIDTATREALSRIPLGPTKRAGALNIQRYNARR